MSKTIRSFKFARGQKAALARRLGVSQQFVGQMVAGSRPVPPKHVLVIEGELGISRHVLCPAVFGDAPKVKTPVAPRHRERAAKHVNQRRHRSTTN